MPLGTGVGLDRGEIVLDGDPALPPPKGHILQFSVHVYCGQTVARLRYCWALLQTVAQKRCHNCDRIHEFDSWHITVD